MIVYIVVEFVFKEMMLVLELMIRNSNALCED